MIKFKLIDLENEKDNQVVEIDETNTKLIDLVRVLLSNSNKRWNIASFFIKTNQEQLSLLPLFIDLKTIALNKSLVTLFYKIESIKDDKKFVSFDFGSDLFFKQVVIDFSIDLKTVLQKEWFIDKPELLSVFVFDPINALKNSIDVNKSLLEQKVSNGSILQFSKLSSDDESILKAKAMKQEANSLYDLLKTFSYKNIQVFEKPLVKNNSDTKKWQFSDKPFYTKEGVNYYLLYK